MRILFICSSLGAGRDGVGDYTRRLAAGLVRQGLECRLLGIADRDVAVQSEDPQECEGIRLLTLRLPLDLSWSVRVKFARQWLDEYGPDWVSLQFVCFGFHRRGFVNEAMSHLQKLVAGYPLHWMFHELWVGLEPGHPLKFRIWGWLQRRYILQLHRRLDPRCIQTSNRRYQTALACFGIDAEIAPIIGGISVSKPDSWITEQAESRLGAGFDRSEWLILGVFGSLQIQWTQSAWFDLVVEQAGLGGQRVALWGMGKLPGPSKSRWAATVERYARRADVYHFGEQSPERLSEYLRYLDFFVGSGIAELAGKSSTVAAALEHRAAVLLPLGEWPGEIPVALPGLSLSSKWGIPVLSWNGERPTPPEYAASRLADCLVRASQSSGVVCR